MTTMGTAIVVDIKGLIQGASKGMDADIALEKIAKEIREIEGRVLTDLFAIRERLLKARNVLRGAFDKGAQEGEWLLWLKTVEMTHQQAGRLIAVFEKYGRGSDVGTRPNLSFSVLAELAAPGADSEGVTGVEAKIASGKPVTVAEAREAVRPKSPSRVTACTTKARSRSARWSDAVSRAIEALNDLRSVQEEYQSWLDNLPENLASSAIAEKLNAVCDLDIEEAIGTVQEYGEIDLPQGFGRD